MDLDTYLKRGQELANSLNLEELSDAGMEKLEDLAIDMAYGAWNPELYEGISAMGDKLWHDVFEKDIYDLSIEVDIPEDEYWQPFSAEAGDVTHADALFADIVEADDFAPEEAERPEYSALTVRVIASDNRPAHSGNSFILAQIYVLVELPIAQFENQAPGPATICFFPEL